MIKPISNRYTPSFKASFMVNVPKAIFENPDDYRACCSTFCTALCDEMHKDLSPLRRLFLSRNSKKCKAAIFPIGVARDIVMESTKYSESWLEARTGIKLEKRPFEDYYSFYVFTDKEKKKALDMLSLKSQNAMARVLNKDENERTNNNKIVDNHWRYSRAYQMIEAATHNIVAESDSTAKFTIESVDDIPELADIMSMGDKFLEHPFFSKINGGQNSGNK